ncbi:hypothetical protein EHW64_09705 [Erwinia psidii]|uniref:hypothetical protein n=1 Tax=Erwinia psidii TaxID=69224 RepID=UPI00226B651F|nr:hypothetical protein [Erwinia psidii]MCX8961416.1 hypothetical protein [Erwinia psidii]
MNVTNSGGDVTLRPILKYNDINNACANNNGVSENFVNSVRFVANENIALKSIKSYCNNQEEKIKFDYPVVFYFADTDNRKNEFKLSFIDRAYRRYMDKEAKKNGMSFAAGHDRYDENSPRCYDNNVAICEYKKLE